MAWQTEYCAGILHHDIQLVLLLLLVLQTGRCVILIVKLRVSWLYDHALISGQLRPLKAPIQDTLRLLTEDGERGGAHRWPRPLRRLAQLHCI